MSVPYVPTPQTTPLTNPAVGSTGAPPIPYLSPSAYTFAPTGVSTSDLNPGGQIGAQVRSLADVIRRATRWVDAICFGADPASKGASLAASLTVDSATIRIKRGELRLLCDYRPLVQLVGVAVGSGMSNLASLDSSLFGLARAGRRSFTIPYAGQVFRAGDSPAYVPGGLMAGSVYAVWSYVNGYPHTKLAQNVTAGDTSCVVDATDGNGGLWAVFPASGAFPGTDLQVVDGASTERVFVQAVTTNTPSAGKTTLTTSPFSFDHTVPATPDFIPVTGVPEDIIQAAISLTTMLVKTRGVKGLQMPTVPGARPSEQVRNQLGQAGALNDYELAHDILEQSGYVVRVKHPGAY